MKYPVTILLITCLAALPPAYPHDKIIMAYWSNYPDYQPYPIPGSYGDDRTIQTNDDLTKKLEQINVFAYAFMQVKENGTIYFTSPTTDLAVSDSEGFCRSFPAICYHMNNTVAHGNFTAFSKLKTKTNLRKIVAIGGAESTQSFSNAIYNPTGFVDSAALVISHYGLDGIDLDFELNKPFTPEEATRYAALVQALREKLGSNSFISVTLHFNHETIDSLGKKNLTLITKNAFLNLMGYEFHNPNYGPNLTAHASNLFLDPYQPKVSNFYHTSVDQAINYLTYFNVPTNRLILGFPSYFVSYGAVPNINHGLYQPFDKTNQPVFDFSKNIGSYRMAQQLLTQGFTAYYLTMNHQISAVFAYNPTNKQWFSYDDQKTISAKAHYTIDNKLAGMMMWTIKHDLSPDNPNSLLRTLNEVFQQKK